MLPCHHQKVPDHDHLGRWLKIYCNCQEVRMNLEKLPVNLFPISSPHPPLFLNSIEVDQRCGGITITTMHSNTNIPIGRFSLFLATFFQLSHLFFGARECFVCALYCIGPRCIVVLEKVSVLFVHCIVVLATRQHQIFPIFLLSQYTQQCNIYFCPQ